MAVGPGVARPIHSGTVERSLVVDALGRRVRIDGHACDREQWQLVERCWRDAVAPPGPADAHVQAVPTGEPNSWLSVLAGEVTRVALQLNRGRLWMLHAAGIAAEDGRVIALVGPSGRGKTTACQAAGAAFEYVSDEVVAIDADGRVWAYRKPLSVKEPERAAKSQWAPTDLGLRVRERPLRLGRIVVLDRIDGAASAGGTPRVEAMDLGDALTDLVAQSSFLADLPAPLRTIASHVAATAGVVRATYADARELSDVWGEVLPAATATGAAVGAAPAGTKLVEPPLVAAPAPEVPREPYARSPHLDAVGLSSPDRIAVLRRDDDTDGEDAGGEAVVHVLAGVAPTLWRHASGASMETLRASAVGLHGTPPSDDAATLVASAVRELEEAGLLQRGAAHWAVAPDVSWTGADDVVACSLRDDRAPVALQGSAAVIWRALAEGGTEAEICERVISVSQPTSDDVPAQVSAFLRDLLTRGLASVDGGMRHRPSERTGE